MNSYVLPKSQRCSLFVVFEVVLFWPGLFIALQFRWFDNSKLHASSFAT